MNAVSCRPRGRQNATVRAKRRKSFIRPPHVGRARKKCTAAAWVGLTEVRSSLFYEDGLKGTLMTIQTFQSDVLQNIASAIRGLGAADYTEGDVVLSPVPENAQGDVALSCFGLRGRLSTLDDKARHNPVAISAALAEVLAGMPVFEAVAAVGPYVNLSYDTAALAQAVIGDILEQGDHFADAPVRDERVVIEFSGPNTNKPQHLGHLRNNVIGESVSRLLQKSGSRVTRVNIINDRGIHICKSMLVYIKHGQNITPQSAGKKGDHLVGDFYVQFEKEFQAEYKTWLESEAGKRAYEEFLTSEAGIKAQKAIEAYELKKKGKAPADLFSTFKSSYKDKYFNSLSPIGKEVTDLLIRWENGDPEVRAIWKRLNDWVIEGFMDTYKTLGISFDKLYFESETYKLGKDIIQNGLEKGIFHRLPDNATAFDLSKIGLNGEKIVLRSNGTSVYITQDIGTAIERYKDYEYDKMIYVTADEQNYHFQVLFGILGELRPDLGGRFEHLSYGMVTLPNGRMKSREGTVVDTDDLIEEMARLVREVMENKADREHYADADEAEFDRRAQTIALAALKYYLLNFTPASWMEFNPEKSLDLQGRTGAYCLMNYARTRSILRKASYTRTQPGDVLSALKTPQEKKLLLNLMQFPAAIQWAAQNRDPSKMAEYLFNLCKSFAFIFTDKAGHPVLNCTDEATRSARLALVDAIGVVLKDGLGLLGIDTLEEM